MTNFNLPNLHQLPAVPSVPVWRLSVEQYHQMMRAEVLTEDDPIELLEGWLVQKMPKSLSHRVTTKLIRRALEKLLTDGYCVYSQPITLTDSEPEPDVVVICGDADILSQSVVAEDVEFVIEVADSTLKCDRSLKKRLYARAGIPEYWVVDLLDPCIEVYTQPTGFVGEPDYQQLQVYGLADLVPVRIKGIELGQLIVKDLLP